MMREYSTGSNFMRQWIQWDVGEAFLGVFECVDMAFESESQSVIPKSRYMNDILSSELLMRLYLGEPEFQSAMLQTK